MSPSQSSNTTWHAAEVTRDQREELLEQRGCIVWFTGLSGSGKSTVARRVEQRLLQRGLFCFGLDGDNLRHGLNADLTFSAHDRKENVRRVGAVAQLFADAGAICIASFVSPYQRDRDAVRALVPAGRFFEVHVATPLAECEARDPKGLYAKARRGEIPNFTGISAPYEEPTRPELRLDTTGRALDECADSVIAALTEASLLSP